MRGPYGYCIGDKYLGRKIAHYIAVVCYVALSPEAAGVDDPNVLRSWSVRSGRSEKLMSFSANRSAYCPRPSFSSQSVTSCMAEAPHCRASSARGATLSEKPATL